MKKSQIGAQLYTIKDFCQTAEDFDKSMAKIKAIGYTSVQLSGIGPIPPATVMSILGKYGLSVCATHIPYDRFINDLDGVIADHKVYKCRHAGLGVMPDKYLESREGILEFCGIADEIARKLNDAGLRFMYHNHTIEFLRHEDGKTTMDLLLENTGDTFDFELDTCWVASGGADNAQWIRKLKGRTAVLHLKDLYIKRTGSLWETEQDMCEIGAGNINFDSIIEAGDEVGMEWFVVEQDHWDRDPFDCLKLSFDNLQRLVK